MPSLETTQHLSMMDLMNSYSSVAQTFNRQQLSATEAVAPILLDDPSMMDMYNPESLEAGAVKASKGEAYGPTERIKATTLEYSSLKMRSELLAEHIVIPRTTIEDARDASSNISLTALVNKRGGMKFAKTVDRNVLIGGAGITFGHDSGWWNNFVTTTGTTRSVEFTDPASVRDNIEMLIAEHEDVGFETSRWLLNKKCRKYLRGLKDADGVPMYLTNIRDDSDYSRLYDIPINWAPDGLMPDEFLGALIDNRFCFYASRVDGKMEAPLTELYAGNDAVGFPIRGRVGSYTLSRQGHRPYTLWTNTIA